MISSAGRAGSDIATIKESTKAQKRRTTPGIQNARADIVFVLAFDAIAVFGRVVRGYVFVRSKADLQEQFQGLRCGPVEVRTKTLGGVEQGEDREDVDVGRLVTARPQRGNS